MENTFETALAALTEAANVAADGKATTKDALKIVAQAQRVVSWLAFDLVQAAPLNEREAMGDSLGEQIGKARQVNDKSLAVYRQRGRDLHTFATVIGDAGKDRVVTHGERKGETINGREESDALTLAKSARENKAKNEVAAKRIVDDMPIQRQAVAELAVERDVSEDTVQAIMQMKGDASAEMWNAVHERMDVIRAKSEARANLSLALQAIRDALQDGAFATLDGAAARIGADDFGSFLADCLVSRREAFNGDADDIAKAA